MGNGLTTTWTWYSWQSAQGLSGSSGISCEVLTSHRDQVTVRKNTAVPILLRDAEMYLPYMAAKCHSAMVDWNLQCQTTSSRGLIVSLGFTCKRSLITCRSCVVTRIIYMSRGEIVIHCSRFHACYPAGSAGCCRKLRLGSVTDRLLTRSENKVISICFWTIKLLCFTLYLSNRTRV